MIIDIKLPPPPYSVSSGPPISSSRPTATFSAIPPHILLHIVYATFPQTSTVDHGTTERQRKTLMWLVNSLRLVDRSFYIACMHVLRSTYLPSYQSSIRPSFSSDPFPTTTSDSRSPTYTESTKGTINIQTIQRETAILDKFIALKVREDVFVDDSELHLEREDMFKDLFDHAQPKARLEDLVRKYGLREGIISVPGLKSASAAQQQGSASNLKTPSQSTSSLNIPPLSPSLAGSSTPVSQPRTPTSRFLGMFGRSTRVSAIPTPYPPPDAPTPPTKIEPIPFSRVSISLAPRSMSLVIGSGTNRRTMCTVQRDNKMKLEMGAKYLVYELRDMLLADAQ